MAAWRGSGGERRPDARAGSRRRGRMAGWREGHMCSSYSRRGSSRALESGGAITFPFSSSASCDFLPIPPDSHVAFLAHPFPFPPRPRFLVFCLYPDADAPVLHAATSPRRSDPRSVRSLAAGCPSSPSCAQCSRRAGGPAPPTPSGTSYSGSGHR